MTWSFINHITNHLDRKPLDEQKHPTQWPSEATAIVVNEYNEQEIVGKCRRSNFFRYLNDLYHFDTETYSDYYDFVNLLNSNSIPADNYIKWIWKQGELYEQYCVDLAKESGVFVAGQTNIYIPKLNVSGKIDLVVINPDTTKYHIVEVKSVYGFNANGVMGTDSERKRGELGKPRESHLMQIGLYQWWYGNVHESFSEGLLVYGARDTGKYAEYKITVEKEEDGLDYIFYEGNSPNSTSKTNSGISLQSVCAQYAYIKDCIDKKVIPERDYKLEYSDADIDLLYSRNLLNKTETAQYEKRLTQINEGKEKLNKQIEKGDWQCDFCQYKNICYDNNKKPKCLSIN